MNPSVGKENDQELGPPGGPSWTSAIPDTPVKVWLLLFGAGPKDDETTSISRGSPAARMVVPWSVIVSPTW